MATKRIFLFSCIFVLGCKSRSFNVPPASVAAPASTEVSNPKPPQFPDDFSAAPWGGRNQAIWKAESVFANAIGAAMNLAWKEPDIVDVFVAVPTRFEYGQYNPYGDGQINSAMGFNSAWTFKRPQLIATLKHYRNGRPSRVSVKFDRALMKGQIEIDVRFRNDASAVPTDLRVKTTRSADGDLLAEFDAIGNWNLAGKSTEERFLLSAAMSSALVRPVGQFNDWLPITFRHPVSSIERLKKTVDAKARTFPVGANVPFPESLEDPLGLKPNSEQESSFSKALNLEIQKKWPKSFNNAHYTSCNVHGDFARSWEDANARKGYPTAVGRNWTWLTNPENKLNQQEQGPFKILYTCFEPRRIAAQQQTDSACVGQPTGGNEEQHGAPSGSGWHLIGDPAETLFNSVERGPLMMGAGFAAPHERISLFPPSYEIAYGLKDVAVARWLNPGEAFLTARSQDPSRPNFHWFLFHSEEHVCTLEWVHPCVPDDLREPSFGSTSCK